LLAAGAVLRLLVMVAYRPAFWFQGDSGGYLSGRHHPVPGSHGLVYPVWLWMWGATGTFWSVTLAQHLAGLAVAGLVYAMLRRRGVAAWLAVAAAAPLALDPYQVVLEHYLLAEGLFTPLLALLVVVLLWSPRPTAAALAGAGLLAATASQTRAVGLPVAALAAAYLAVRGIGWRRLSAFVTATALPLLACVVWFHHLTGVWGLSADQGGYLYGQAAKVADCGRLRLDPQLRALCPTEPLDHRAERADWYLYDAGSPAARLPLQGRERDRTLMRFDVAVITQQPLDYGYLVAADTSRFLLPFRDMGPRTTCLAGWWRMPADPRDPSPSLGGRCRPLLGGPDYRVMPVVPTGGPTRLTRALHWYSLHARTPRIALLLAVLAALAAAVWRPRRLPGWRHDGLDALLLAGTGLAILTISVATSMFDLRYGVPALAVLPAAGALGVHRLAATARDRKLDHSTRAESDLIGRPLADLPSR
jgi:hypothetical protein